MAYVDPQSIHNPATDTIAPASWGDTVRDDLQWLSTDKPNCHALATGAAQSISNTTWTALALGAETWDVGGMHSTVTNNSRLTIPSGGDGKYRIFGEGSFASNGTGIRGVRVLISGALVGGQNYANAVTGVEQHLQVQCVLQLAAGDYVELQVYQSSGGSLNSGTSAFSQFHAVWEAV